MVTTAMMVSSVLWPWARTARPGASAVIAQDLLSRLFPRHRVVRGLVPGCRPPCASPAAAGTGRTDGRRALVGTRSHPDGPDAEASLSDAATSPRAGCVTRSEERRVGKGWRSRGAATP